MSAAPACPLRAGWLAVLLAVVPAGPGVRSAIAQQEVSDAAPAGPLGHDGYARALDRVADALEAGDSATAGVLARELVGRTVTADPATGEPVSVTDATVLGPIAAGQDGGARRLAALRALRASLGDVTSDGSPDRALLEDVARRHAEAPLETGGELGPTLRTPSLSERFRAALVRFFEAIAEVLADLLAWLLSLFPKREHGGGPGVDAALLPILAIAGVVAAALALIAWRGRGRAVQALPAVELVGDELDDDDPVSRTASQWEERALELARAGRLREALRAWYNGVLATLHASGALVVRRGRTNWEHVASLAPALPWRGDFVQLTSEFDREWYGLRATTGEALERFAALARGVMRAAGSRRPSPGAP